MDIDENTGDRQTEVAGITYQLHPRVLFRVADASTRVEVGCSASTGGQDGSPAAMEVEVEVDAEVDAEDVGLVPSTSALGGLCRTAVGCLLGEQQGRLVEIINSFDMPSMDIDWTLFQKKIDLYKEMYPSMDVVGWYVTMPKESAPGEELVRLHKAFAEQWCPSPVLMVYDPREPTEAGQEGTRNALRLFESEEHNNQTVFRSADFQLHSTDVERIVVNQFRDLLDISDDPAANTSSATVKAHHGHLQTAVTALIERVTELQRVLIGIKEGRLEYDEGVVMAIAAFIDRLPVSPDGMSLSKGHESSEGLVQQQKDALLKALLACTMAGAASLETHASFDAWKAMAQEEVHKTHAHGHVSGQNLGPSRHSFGTPVSGTLRQDGDEETELVQDPPHPPLRAR